MTAVPPARCDCALCRALLELAASAERNKRKMTVVQGGKGRKAA